MEAFIKRIELKRILTNYYLKIELSDIEGNTYIVGNPFFSNPIQFRKQLFGIMSACNCFDLMRLATDDPIPKNAIGYYKNRLLILENSNQEWLKYDKEKELYVCQKKDKNLMKVLEQLIEYNLTEMDISVGEIRNIISESGVFLVSFWNNNRRACFTTGQIYYGFGHPINIGDENNTKGSQESARMFTSFIVSIMKFWGINDLLHLGGNIERYPQVEIRINDKNEVEEIVNPETGKGLAINNGYKIIDSNSLVRKR